MHNSHLDEDVLVYQFERYDDAVARIPNGLSGNWSSTRDLTHRTEG